MHRWPRQKASGGKVNAGAQYVLSGSVDLKDVARAAGTGAATMGAPLVQGLLIHTGGAPWTNHETDLNVSGIPFNFDAIPLWPQSDLWDETKVVPYRGARFIFLYALSMAAFGTIIFLPIGFYFGKDGAGVIASIWLIGSSVLGIPFGLAAWRDFIRRSREQRHR